MGECPERRGDARGKGTKKYIPSSLPRTRFTAPEHPPHDMLTLNLYVCSAPSVCASTGAATAGVASAIWNRGVYVKVSSVVL